MKQLAFPETRCGLLGSDAEGGVGGKHAPKKQFLSSSFIFFSEKSLVPLSEEYFLSTCPFFTDPEETSDESWPDTRKDTGAELGQCLNKRVPFFFGNCWKSSYPLPFG